MAPVREGPVVSHSGYGFVQTACVNQRMGRRPQGSRRGNCNNQGQRPNLLEAAQSAPFPLGPRRVTTNGNNNFQGQQSRRPHGPKNQFNLRRSRWELKGKGPQHGPNNAPRNPRQRRGYNPVRSGDGDIIMRDAPVYKQPVRRPGISAKKKTPPEDVEMLDAFITPPPNPTAFPPIELLLAALSLHVAQLDIDTAEEPKDIEMMDAPLV
ncbi:hypothetical protein ETB97_012023 [Aspergillus alliaceus]|uniref:Uncharacterized protein n=1 Tax=Petromyces alliaceus TaxID=209559 RepID=A0A8H6ADA0_PETAA|nr:hypothetical protein ETB97_012023 [Aspergillus burnettii]